MNKASTSNKLQESKLAPPPPHLPVYGKDKPEFVSYVAWSNYEAALEQKRFLFGVRRRDLRRGSFVIGRPGMGKTKLLQVMIRQDIAHGYGFTLFDFRGVLSQALYRDIPTEKSNQVFVLDPSSADFQTGLNPLQNVSPNFRQPMVRIIKQTLAEMYSQRWNPELEYLAHNIFSSVLLSSNPTVRLAHDLLTDESIRAEVAEEIDDASLAKFLVDDFDRWEREHEARAVLPLINILRDLVLQPNLENLYDQPTCAFDFDSIFSSPKNIIIRLDANRLGDTATGFLGTLIMSRYLEQAQNRPNSDTLAIRSDHSIYFDEYPFLDNAVFQSLISAGSNLGIPSIVATTSTLSGTADTVQRLLARTDNLFCFRLFGEDATRLRSEMLPVFDTRDLQNLGPREMYCRIVIDGDLTEPFSAETLEVHPLPDTLSLSKLVETQNQQFGLPVEGLY